MNEKGAYKPVTALYLLRGRDKPFDDEDAEYYEATIHVRMQHIPKYARTYPDDLRCVAERAVYAAALAYNLANTRITSVRLERIVADDE